MNSHAPIVIHRHINRLPPLVGRWYALGFALLLLGATSLLMFSVRTHVNILSVALIFLIVLVAIPLFADRLSSSASAIVAFMLFDVLFIEPYYTLSVASTDHVLALVVFLSVATVVSQLAYRLRVRATEALAHGRRMTILFELSQVLITESSAAGILNAVVARTIALLGVRSCAVLLLNEVREPQIHAAGGPPPPIKEPDHRAVMQWAVEHRQPAGLGGRQRVQIRTRDGVHRRTPPRLVAPRRGTTLYIPISTAREVIGLFYVGDSGHRQQLANVDQQLLLTFANQIALALERVQLAEDATRAAVIARSDALKTALLSAVSHDLRTPLATIKAGATSLLQEGIIWSPEDQRDLLEAIDEETDRMTRLVSNLLDLTRIEAGVLRPNLAWNDPIDVVQETVRRAQLRLSNHTICVHLTPPLPPTLFDDVEIGQVLFNLLENAGKYAPAGTPIDVTLVQDGDTLVFGVEDRGPGVPPDRAERIFEKFYRLEERRAASGAGIGLAICRGIVEAHGGRISVVARDGGGSRFQFTMPIQHRQADAVEEGTWAHAS